MRARASSPQARRRIFHAIGPGEMKDLAADLAFELGISNWDARGALAYALNHENWHCEACIQEGSEIPSAAQR